MHIAVVTKNMKAGGAERVIAQLLHSWSEQGVKCSLICINPEVPFYSIPKSVNCIDIPDFSSNGDVNKIRKYIRLRHVVRGLHPDVVLSLPEEIGVYAALALWGTRIPVVVSERNNPWFMPYKKITRALRRVVYPFVKGLIFQTGKAASFFSASQRRKGIVLPNPLDITRLPEFSVCEREKIVVSAGRLETQKNFDLLLEAFADFYRDHNDYSLKIYGEGSLRTALTEHADRLDLPKGVILFPGVSDNLLEEIKCAGMFVLPSDYEGMPNVLIEAMACGIPCISTDCPSGGPAEIINNGQNGLLVPTGDSEAMASAMRALADDQILAKMFSQQYVTTRVRFNADAVCQEWLDYLKKVSD